MKKNCYNCTDKTKCLECKFNKDECYKYRHNMDKKTSYLDEFHQIAQHDTACSEQVTTLPEDMEDKFRKFLYDMFDLQPLELLMLQAIMNQKELIDFTKDMNSMIQKLQKNGMTRFHSFQLRKSIHQKLGERFGQCLLTKGQRKPLKAPITSR